MEFVGIITAVSGVEEKAGGNAMTPQAYRDVVVETQEEYPKGVCATLKGDAARGFDLPEGTKVRVYFELRVHRSKSSGKWFTTASAWKIERCY